MQVKIRERKTRKKQSRRPPEYPRNHYCREDADAIDFVVTLNGKPQKYAIEANIRGKWVARYAQSTDGLVLVDPKCPTELLIEKVYGEVAVVKKY